MQAGETAGVYIANQKVGQAATITVESVPDCFSDQTEHVIVKPGRIIGPNSVCKIPPCSNNTKSHTVVCSIHYEFMIKIVNVGFSHLGNKEMLANFSDLNGTALISNIIVLETEQVSDFISKVNVALNMGSIPFSMILPSGRLLTEVDPTRCLRDLQPDCQFDSSTAGA